MNVPAETITPGNARELAAALADADGRGVSVIPRGGGTKTEWGNAPSRADVVISTAKLNRVVEHAAGDMTVIVEAGCRIADMQSELAQRGQRLMIDPLWQEQATVGGILATNDSGAWRLRYGGLRDLVIGMTIALPDGTLAESGGRVVKNVAGYDLPKLFTGSLGTLGIITRAVFRLHPLPHASRTFRAPFSGLSGAQSALLALQSSQLAHTALQLRASSDGGIQLDLLLEGTEAGIAAQRSMASSSIGGAKWEEIVADQAAGIWNARQALWPVVGQGAIAKVSVLPTAMAQLIELIQSLADGSWSLVAQATGLAIVKMNGDFTKLREALETQGGSCVMLTPIEGMDAWGAVGNAAPLMRAVKAQFDPKGTLNPGRFVGGI